MNTAGYAYLSARISVFAGRLVPEQQIAAYIAGDRLDGAPGDTAQLDALFTTTANHSDLFEQALLIELLKEMQILVRPLAGPERAFISYAVRIFELANLKAIIRGKFSDLPDELVRAQLADLGEFARLPTEQLLRTEDLPEMLRVLETTAYAGIARHVRRIFQAEHDLFAVDAAIDHQYFVGMYSRTYALRAEQRGALLRLLGILLDRIALVWLLRYRFSYGLTSAEAFYQLVPSCGSLNSALLSELARMETLAAVIESLPAHSFDHLRGATSIREVEDRMEFSLRDAARVALRDITHPVARTFAFFLLLDAQLREILTAYKGIRQGFPSALIHQASRLSVRAA